MQIDSAFSVQSAGGPRRCMPKLKIGRMGVHTVPWLAELQVKDPSRVCVMGIGNRFRGDDGAGLRVIEQRDRDAAGIWIDGGTTPESFLEPIVRAAVELVLIVDVVDFGGRPGECRLLEVDELETFAVSSHNGSLELVRDYLAARSGAVTRVVGIQPGRLRLGSRLSDPVAKSARELACLLSRLLAS